MKALLAVVTLLTGCAAPPPPGLVANVRADIRDDLPPVPPAARLFSRTDISPDGVPDWRADYERAGAAWCGTGGCTQKLFVSRPGGGHILAFEEQVREFAIRAAPSGAVLDIEVHGTNCGLSGVQACRRSFRWNEPDGRFVEHPNVNGEGRLAGPLFQPLPVTEADYPPAVATALADLTAACARSGGVYREAAVAVARSPDLTGDGQADWIVGSDHAWCARPSLETGETNQLAGPGLKIISGALVVLSLPTSTYAVDVGASPAIFIRIAAGDDCGGQEQAA